MIRRFLLVILAALFVPQFAQAQSQGSEKSVLKQQITGTEITIEYSRPSVRGRTLWGELEKWGHVWTPGANMATTIKFSKDVKLNGKDIKAGNYSMWFHLVEAGPWELMLHADSTKGHLPAPLMTEAFAVVDIHPEQKADFTETLTWNFEHVRADGAKLEFRWGNTLVPIQLGVDLGFTYKFERAAVAPFEGKWLQDRSMTRPPDSTIAKWKERAPADELDGINKYLASLDKKQTIEVKHDSNSGMLLMLDQSEEDKEMNPDGFYSSALIEYGTGVFANASLMNGEIAFASTYSFYEFEFDENGLAQVMVERDAKTDDIYSRSTRINE